MHPHTRAHTHTHVHTRATLNTKHDLWWRKQIVLGRLFAAHAVGLRRVDVSRCPAVQDSVMHELVGAGRGVHLTHLKMAGCCNLSDNFALALAASPRALRVLNLCGCKAVADFPLARAIQACAALVELHLENSTCAEATLAAISGALPAPPADGSGLQTEQLAAQRACPPAPEGPGDRGLQGLELLDLGQCDYVNDLLLVPVLENCGRLRALSLSRSRLVTDDTLLSVPNPGTPKPNPARLGHLASRCLRADRRRAGR